MGIDGKVYFYIYPEIVPDKYGGNIPYQHSIVCLAEGFKELGIEFYSNTDYWKLKPDSDEYLFKHDPDITPDDCSLVIINDRWFNGTIGSRKGYPMPKDFFKPDRKYLTAYMDADDGAHTYSWLPEFQKFDFVFKGHYNSNIKYPSKKFYPWALGLSNRIINETNGSMEFEQRRKNILLNSRMTHPLRTVVNKKIMPLINRIFPIDDSTEGIGEHPDDTYNYLQWLQSGKRHNPKYYKRLKETMLCSAFGGYFITPYPHEQLYLTTRVLNLLIQYLVIQTNVIIQFDSWRFWEALASGCIPVHVDLEKYGCTFPIMPKSGEHYIGFDLSNPAKGIKFIEENENSLKDISKKGREWALKYYGPVPTTERFLSIIQDKMA